MIPTRLSVSPARRAAWCAVACLALLRSTAAQAQEPSGTSPVADAPPTRIGASVGTSGVAAGGFGDAWRPGIGAGGRLDVPAYGGRLRASLTVLPFASRTGDRSAIPSFVAVVPTLGWGPALALPGGARASAGPVVGIVQARFPEHVGPGGTSSGVNETEAVVGLFGSVRVPLGGRLAAWADVEALRMALDRPRALVGVGAGLSVDLGVPPALVRAAR